MGNDIQLWLQKCKPKFAAFRPSKIKWVMDQSKLGIATNAVSYNGCFNTYSIIMAKFIIFTFMCPV